VSDIAPARRAVVLLSLGLLVAHGLRMRDFGRIIAVDDYTGLSETLEFGAASTWRVTGQGYFSLHRVGLLTVSALDPWHWAIALFGLSVVAWWMASMGLLWLGLQTKTPLGVSVTVATLPLAVPIRLVSTGGTTDVPFGLAYAHFPIAVAAICGWMVVVRGALRCGAVPISVGIGVAGLMSPMLGPVILILTVLAWSASVNKCGAPYLRDFHLRLLGPAVAALLATVLQVLRWTTRSNETPATWQELTPDYSGTSHLRTVGLLESVTGAAKSLVLAFLPESIATWTRDLIGTSIASGLLLFLATVGLGVGILKRRDLERQMVAFGLMTAAVVFLFAQSIAKHGAQVRYMIVPFVLGGAGITFFMATGSARARSWRHSPSLGLTCVVLLWAVLLVTRFDVAANSDDRVRSWRANLIVARDECRLATDDSRVLVRVTVKQPDDVGLVVTCGYVR